MHIFSSLVVFFAAFSAIILPARAAPDEVLTIYTYESFVAEWGPGPAVQKAFEESCDCSIKWVALGDGVAVLNRLKLEGDKGKADIVLGLDTNLTSEAASTGLFQPHGLELPETTIPGGYRDEIFVPFDHGFFAVVYDSEVIDTPPSSLKELVEGDPEQKIVIQDPRSSTPGLGLVLWVRKVYGDDAPAAWEKLKDRVLTVTPGWSEAYGLFTDGEAPMVLSYTTSPAYHMIEEDSERYRAAAFDEGHYQQIEVAGITAMTDQKQLAQDFLKFMAGPEFQNIIPTKNWMLPAFAVKEALPAAFDTLVEPSQALSFPADEIEDNRKAWIDEWLAVMSR